MGGIISFTYKRKRVVVHSLRHIKQSVDFCIISMMQKADDPGFLTLRVDLA
jgi:hypothetical protein